MKQTIDSQSWENTLEGPDDMLWFSDFIIRLAADKARSCSPDIPDLYPAMAALVANMRAIRNVLDALPNLTELDPAEYYDSQGDNPGESMERAEFAQKTASEDLELVIVSLNYAWSYIGRIGREILD